MGCQQCVTIFTRQFPSKKESCQLPSFLFSFLEHKCNGFKTSLLKHSFFLIYELVYVYVCFEVTILLRTVVKLKVAQWKKRYMISPYSRFEFSFLSLSVYNTSLHNANSLSAIFNYSRVWNKCSPWKIWQKE